MLVSHDILPLIPSPHQFSMHRSTDVSIGLSIHGSVGRFMDRSVDLPIGPSSRWVRRSADRSVESIDPSIHRSTRRCVRPSVDRPVVMMMMMMMMTTTKVDSNISLEPKIKELAALTNDANSHRQRKLLDIKGKYSLDLCRSL